jgi:hypothetical protein
MGSVAEFDSEDEMRRVIDRLDDQEFFGQRLRITQVLIVTEAHHQVHLEDKPARHIEMKSTKDQSSDTPKREAD